MTRALDFELVDDAAKATEHYVRAVNAGDVDAVARFYTEDAIAVRDGKPLSGQALRAHLVEFIGQRPAMTATAKHIYEAGDATLLVTEWTVDLPGENGATEHFEGVGLDVLRKGEDNKWRYAVDDPDSENR